LSFSAPVFAGLDSQNQNFLLGGEMAYVRQDEKFTTRFSSPLTIPVTPIDYHSEKINDNGIIFGLLAGWQYRLCRFMLGVEGNVIFQNANILRGFQFNSPSNEITYNATAYYDRGPTWALTGRVGYFVTPGFLPYVRFGVQASRDEVNYQVFAVPTLPTGLGSDFSSEKTTVFGVVAGAGVELPTFIGASTIRFEYTFTRSDRIQIEDEALPILGTHKFHYPQTSEFKVAWIWNFC
jgi:opacity protein-like surface antigen